MGQELEVADDVRAFLPSFAVEEARQALAREDSVCPLCKGRVGRSDDASLLVTLIGPEHRIALTHRACRPSQIFAISPEGRALLPDTFSLAWHATLRAVSPRAVFLWENKTNFDAWAENESGGATGALEALGFEGAEGSIDRLTPPRAHYFHAVSRGDELELRTGGVPGLRFPERQPDAWRIAAEQDGEILVLYGTALGLDHYDDDRLGRRIDAGKVVGAIVPFQQERLPAATPGGSRRRRAGTPRLAPLQ